MTRDDTQTARRDEICWGILRSVGLGLLWNDGGPAPDAFALAEGEITPYQHVALRAALGIWNGSLEPSAAVTLGLA